MPFGSNPVYPKQKKISVEFMISQLTEKIKMKVQACAAGGACMQRYLTEADLHRPGLALTGYTHLFAWKRVQILGNTECEYLSNLSTEEQRKSFGNLTRFDIPIIFVTAGNELSPALLKMAEEAIIPVFTTPLETVKFMYLLRDFLEDQFALQTIVHGAMVDVYGIGILITGKAGIGKSEVALDLIERGHRLVADDVVTLTKKNNVLLSAATDMNKHFMEIRGLGIVDIMSMFGIRAVRYQKRLEVVLDLYLWDDARPVDRTGLEKKHVEILDVQVPLIELPITPGKNITVIAEVIAMNYLLNNYGYDAAKAFQERIKTRIAHKKKTGLSDPRRVVDYFEGDTE
ncbi:MAG: HPr(Ser) kinase/phosphatase [Balneolales bacterium]|nr:HPr(Ser) kinase/phosphatase [Balneolales bacterium]